MHPRASHLENPSESSPVVLGAVTVATDLLTPSNSVLTGQCKDLSVPNG